MALDESAIISKRKNYAVKYGLFWFLCGVFLFT